MNTTCQWMPTISSRLIKAFGTKKRTLHATYSLLKNRCCSLGVTDGRTAANACGMAAKQSRPEYLSCDSRRADLRGMQAWPTSCLYLCASLTEISFSFFTPLFATEMYGTWEPVETYNPKRVFLFFNKENRFDVFPKRW